MTLPMIAYVERPEPQEDWTLPADLAELAREKGTGLVRDLFADFRSDTTARLESVCEALTKGNLTRTRTEAHTIKGSAVQVGAARLARLCKRMEQSAVAGDMDKTASVFEEMETEFARVLQKMDTLNWTKV